ncbi:MAG: NB-ARC domain-containing protein, partial [Chloroflexota bacterium]|nr:NB-ARC domain-containing protein [Chloroflexota bacterium]
ITRLLAAHRLVTLTGVGGCGKTRLALAVAGRALSEYEHGVWLVELAPLADPHLVPQAVAAALELKEESGRAPMDLLVDRLRQRELLLVLDNCEHLVEASAQLVEGLLHACPQVRVLATSRESLRAEGEVSWLVPSLSLPPHRTECSPRVLAAYESVRLFLDRAGRHRPGFELTETSCSAVVEICRRLDGIPLAIELAAARVRSMSVEQISERLDNSLGLLAGGTRTASPRQQTLRATLDWSYELLGELERQLFRRLSVFRGGWLLEQAEVVGAGEPAADQDVSGLLEMLVEKSLVLAEPTPNSSMRYRMLEPVRQYAEQKLRQSGEEDVARSRHAATFLSLAELAEAGVRGRSQLEWYDRLEAGRDNLRAAFTWYLEQARYEDAARLGTSLWIFWWVRGPLSEGRHWMESLMGVDGLSTARLAWVYLVAASLSYGQGDYDASDRYSRQVLDLPRDDVEARTLGLAWVGIGLPALERRDYRQATTCLQHALRELRGTGDDWLISQTLSYLGATKLTEGDREAAVPILREALALSKRADERMSTYIALYHLALAEQGQRNHELAAGLFREALALSVELGDQANLGYCLEGLAGVVWALGDAERTARLLGASEALLGKVEGPVYSYYRSDPSLRERTVEAVRSRLGKEAFELAWDQGRSMPVQAAVRYALESGRAPDRSAPLETFLHP